MEESLFKKYKLDKKTTRHERASLVSVIIKMGGKNDYGYWLGRTKTIPIDKLRKYVEISEGKGIKYFQGILRNLNGKKDKQNK